MNKIYPHVGERWENKHNSLRKAPMLCTIQKIYEQNGIEIVDFGHSYDLTFEDFITDWKYYDDPVNDKISHELDQKIENN